MGSWRSHASANAGHCTDAIALVKLVHATRRLWSRGGAALMQAFGRSPHREITRYFNNRRPDRRPRYLMLRQRGAYRSALGPAGGAGRPTTPLLVLQTARQPAGKGCRGPRHCVPQGAARNPRLEGLPRHRRAFAIPQSAPQNAYAHRKLPVCGRPATRATGR